MRLLLLSVGLLTSLFSPSLLAQNPENAFKNTRYLALGDSIAFGYNPTVPIALANYQGYPEYVSNAVHQNVANASCVGETTGSFLHAGVPDLGCAAWRQAGLPLHVPYTGTQADYAVAYLRANPNVKLVTINIGGNDLGLLQIQCANDINCELAALPRVLADYAAKLTAIFARIRFEAGYKGPLVLLTYYAFDYSSLVNPQTGAFIALNGIASSITTAFGGKVADGFTAFQQASIGYGGSPCAAGLLIPLPSGGCDVHPTVAGQKVLATAILKVVK